jgi:hypothetical protein
MASSVKCEYDSSVGMDNVAKDLIRRNILELKNDPRALATGLDWAMILRAASELSKAVEPDGQFAGAWVGQRVMRQPGAPPRAPGLRPLSSRGLLTVAYTTRGGNRAYYRMPDREAIEEVLDELGIPPLSAA